ncbi:hypothetical protein [Actinokineospora sp.]|uniref:hypothetical protein n=1 Tax=Actinokineospora sp. TaxID=1872133 RepID=UPI004037B945
MSQAEVDVTVPSAVGASRLAAAAAVVLGVAVIAGFNAVPNTGARFALLLVVIGLGVATFAVAARPYGRYADAIGARVLRGIGGAAVLLGAYLTGPLLVATATPERFGSDPAPSPTTLVVLTYLPPALALVWLAVKDIRAGVVGLGLVVPTVALTVLVLAEVGPLTVTLAMLALAIAGAVVAAAGTAGSAWSVLGTVTGALSASAAVGTGVQPLGSLTAADLVRTESAGTLGTGMQVVVIVAGLGIAGLLALLAVLRRDATGGVLAAAALMVPPVAFLLATLDPNPDLDAPRLALAAVPVLAAVGAVLALRVPSLRRRADGLARRLRPGGATSAQALAAVAGLATVAFAAQAVPVLGWDDRVQGMVTLVLLAGAAVLALRLPGVPGALLAGATLVALALASPWRRLVVGPVDVRADPYEHLSLTVGIGLVVAVAATVVLLRGHPHPGVAAAGAYLLLGTVALQLWALLRPAGRALVRDDPAGPVAVLIVPLLLLGLPAAVVALRARTARGVRSGQAVLAVVLAAGGFALLGLLAQTYTSVDSAYQSTLSLSLATLTPTDALAVSRLIGDPGTNLVLGVGALLLLAIVAVQTTVRASSSALTAATLLVVVAATQAGLGAALTAGGIETFDAIQWTTLALGAALASSAMVAARTPPTPSRESAGNAAPEG